MARQGSNPRSLRHGRVADEGADVAGLRNGAAEPCISEAEETAVGGRRPVTPPAGRCGDADHRPHKPHDVARSGAAMPVPLNERSRPPLGRSRATTTLALTKLEPATTMRPSDMIAVRPTSGPSPRPAPATRAMPCVPNASDAVRPERRVESAVAEVARHDDRTRALLDRRSADDQPTLRVDADVAGPRERDRHADDAVHTERAVDRAVRPRRTQSNCCRAAKASTIAPQATIVLVNGVLIRRVMQPTVRCRPAPG